MVEHEELSSSPTKEFKSCQKDLLVLGDKNCRLLTLEMI